MTLQSDMLYICDPVTLTYLLKKEPDVLEQPSVQQECVLARVLCHPLSRPALLRSSLPPIWAELRDWYMGRVFSPPPVSGMDAFIIHALTIC